MALAEPLLLRAARVGPIVCHEAIEVHKLVVDGQVSQAPVEVALLDSAVFEFKCLMTVKLSITLILQLQCVVLNKNKLQL